MLNWIRALPVRTRQRIVVVVPIVVAFAAVSLGGVAHAAGLYQPATDPALNWLIAVLAVPGVTMIVTKLLDNIAAAVGIKSRVVVYVASYIVLGVTLFLTGAQLPTYGGDPHTYVMAWLTWGTVNAETARRYYEALTGVLGLGADA